MSFVVDLVSEDSFYVNLLLGLHKVLSRHPQISDVKLKRFTPCEKSLVSSWEQKNGIPLPCDMRRFYLSTDGFSLTWVFKYADQQLPVGNLHVRPLAELSSISYIPSEVHPCGGGGAKSPAPELLPTSKIFEMDVIHNSKIFLIYEKIDVEPNIWILDNDLGWFMITDSFTKYFRMMLVHHGLPHWQYCLIPKPLATCIEEIYLLIAPHLLQQVKRRVKSHRESCIPDLPHNHIDPVIFNTDSQSLPRRYRH